MVTTPKVRLPLAYKVCVVIAKSFAVPMAKREWRGAEHLNQPSGIIVCPNHISQIDPFVVAHFLYDNGRPPFFLAKEAVFRIPVLGRLLTAAQQIPVYRNTGRARDAYDAGLAALRQGKTVPCYPEGTITKDPDLWPMTPKTGAARMALATKLPVIPVAQWGANELMPPYSGSFKPLPRKTVRVLAGPPVDLTDLYDRPMTTEVLREASERIVTEVTRLLEELRGQTAPAGRFDARTGERPLPRPGFDA